ncbi:MAG TPA: EamA family transporter [Bacteriovoracaceae bacterium]|nr:EamA family transporter [Bacteriovoracaceae bacterium]
MIKPVFLLLVAMISIQSGAAFAKKLFPTLGAAGTTSLRLFLAAMILWIIWKPWKFTYTAQDLKKLFLYGASLGFMNLLFYFAIERIPLGVAVAFEFTGPLAIAVLNSKKHVDYLWALLAAIGIYLLLPVSGSSDLDPVGILFALGAGLCWALYILFGQKAGNNLHGGLASTIGMTFATVLIVPFGLSGAGEKLFDPTLLPLGLGVAIFSSALPYSLEMMALKSLSTQTFGVLMSLEPAIAAIAGLIFLSEQLLLLQWLAIFLIIISSLGSSLSNPAKDLA